MKNDPKWWTEEHTGAWDRIKDAMKRDWEQTKADFSKKAGHELDQNAGDTVKQAAGSERIPPANVPNAKPAPTKAGEVDWERAERGYRYGVGARAHYGSPTWDEGVESKLGAEWKNLDSEATWDEAKANVRRGYERDGK